MEGGVKGFGEEIKALRGERLGLKFCLPVPMAEVGQQSQHRCQTRCVGPAASMQSDVETLFVLHSE